MIVFHPVLHESSNFDAWFFTTITEDCFYACSQSLEQCHLFLTLRLGPLCYFADNDVRFVRYSQISRKFVRFPSSIVFL